MEVDAGEFIRVQSMAQKGIPEVPPEYIQPPESRPPRFADKKGASHVQIPVIDLSLSGNVVRDAIGMACEDWGAFHVLNHGVPVELLEEMRKAGRTFFEESTMQQKREYACDPNSPSSEGYGSRMLAYSKDSVLDWRDYFDHHTLPVSRRNPSRWPHFPHNYREVVLNYSDHMEGLAKRLLAVISESLGLPSSCFQEAVGEFYQNITISYYPPCPQPDLTLGLQSHSDIGAISLLIQDDVSGLEVFKDNDWVIVPPIADAIFVILADQTEIISNGRYRSAPHRAITNAERARLSVATFHDPAKTRRISPVFNPPRYREVIYGDYLKSWYIKGPEGKQNINSLLL